MFNLHNHAERLFRVFPAIRILGFDIMEMQRKLGDNFGGIFMDKEEILRKAQKEDSDEMKVQIRDKSMKMDLYFNGHCRGCFFLISEICRGIQ